MIFVVGCDSCSDRIPLSTHSYTQGVIHTTGDIEVTVEDKYSTYTSYADIPFENTVLLVVEIDGNEEQTSSVNNLQVAFNQIPSKGESVEYVDQDDNSFVIFGENRPYDDLYGKLVGLEYDLDQLDMNNLIDEFDTDKYAFSFELRWDFDNHVSGKVFIVNTFQEDDSAAAALCPSSL